MQYIISNTALITVMHSTGNTGYNNTPKYAEP